MENFWIERRSNSYKFEIKRHFEHFYQIVYVLSGKILYTVAGKKYEVEKGGMIVLNTLEEHELEVLEYPYERYIIQINPTFFQNSVKSPKILSIFIKRHENFSHMINLSKHTNDDIFKIICEMEQEYKNKDEYWQLYIGADIQRMFITIFREKAEELNNIKVGSGAEIAYKILCYIENNYTEDITVEHIATKLYLNKHYIAHVFKDETGYSPIEYVISLRINKAKALLAETDENISDIASECGYTDFAHFSRQFKKVTTFSPSSFRKRYKTHEI